MDSLRRVYTGSECRQLDKIAIDELGISSFRLMYRAANFAMSEMLKRWSNPVTVSIVCGSGNNAGDGYLLAAALHAKKYPIQLLQTGDVSRLKGDAKGAFEQARALGIEPSNSDSPTGEIIVDALLGTGVEGAVRPEFADMIQKMNVAGKPIVSLDIPSGIDPDTGGFLVDTPVRAQLTACFVGLKICLLTGRARNCCGEIVSSTLEIPDEAYERVPGTSMLPVNDGEKRFPVRNVAAHKRDFGHVLIVAGNMGMGGAGLLAAEAALRSSAGLVSVSTHPSHAGIFLARRPELMVKASSDGSLVSDQLSQADVVVVGPGLGRDEWAKRALTDALSSGKRLVIDADALNLLAENNSELPINSIITPHPGEAARLLGISTNDIENDRIGAVKTLSERFQAIAVLKGAGTLVAESGELHGICEIAESALSTAGSGDVLAGVIGAAYAQIPEAITAASLGVHLHGTAGIHARKNLARRAVIASDLIEALRPWG